MLSVREIQELQRYIIEKCHKLCKHYDIINGCLKGNMYIDNDIRTDPCRLYEEKERGANEKVTDKFRCRLHPRYSGKSKPANRCDECWRMFMES